MARPFSGARIEALEEKFQRNARDPEILELLLDELGHRSTQRAVRLRERVAAALAEVRRQPPRGAPRPARAEKPTPAPPRPGSQRERTAPAPPPPPRSRSAPGTPEAVLDAWTALEVLSPPLSFRRPEDLASGDRSAVVMLDRGPLPWSGEGERSRPGKRLFYQVVLGTVELDTAFARLLSRYTDRRPERPSARGEAALAVLVVDRTGRPAGAPPVAVSSFGWGLPRALAGELGGLAEWKAAESHLAARLEERLQRVDREGEPLPLDRATLDEAFRWLSGTLGLPPELVKPPRLAIRAYEYFKSPDPPEPLLLNSFFLEDLGEARALFAAGKATPNLRRYLGVDVPAGRRDLLHDVAALEDAVSPWSTPPARWPGPGRHPLVLLQQAAVNLAMRELRDHGIVAVNGPPGTGKTTLLRDLVAAVVTERATAMAAFDDPAAAFTDAGQQVRAGQGSFRLHRLDTRLKGFEILVASSNNKAVENVSAELPGLKAVAQDAAELRYFATLSDALGGGETWGLVAAVLGNAANRGRFRQTFWWDKDVGMATYLAAAAGTPQTFEAADPATGARELRPPRIVTAEGAPRDRAEAQRRWRTARASFLEVLKESQGRLAALERARALATTLATLAGAETEAAATLASARETDAAARDALRVAKDHVTRAQEQTKVAEMRLSAHDRHRPGFFARLFRTSRAREWSAGRKPLARSGRETRAAVAEAAREVSRREQAAREASASRETAERRHADVARRHAQARREVEAARARIGPRFADPRFFEHPHEERQQATPWLDDEDQRARDAVFVAAMALHKAFVDAAAHPLRHNLGALLTSFGRGLEAEKQALVPDLWSSLFLLVPLVSTTFASVGRMLGGLPPQSLGWLLVDEAGQALPQAAVGALMRTRRAVVVGDPMQIEPVVVLPEALTGAICRHFGVDPDRFDAPDASAQSLADAATPYVGEIHSSQGSRRVGVPLLVHRRCAEPMFGISNAIAYEHLMVQAKRPGPSRIREVLGPSAWLHVEGSAEEKWSPEEGAVVLRLLHRLAEAGVVPPDLYVVTPFVVVQDRLRKLVRDSGLLQGWGAEPWKWASERIGTVHTVQGREAEAVIFVLGAPDPQQGGARSWAGGRPNLLNVAVTRAKEQLYVVGNRRLWRDAGVFRELDGRLPRSRGA